MMKRFLYLLLFLPLYTFSQPQSIRQQVIKIASGIKAQVGVSAMIVETGDTVNYRAGDKFPMQSVYKLPIAIAVLHQVELGRLSLNQQVKVSRAEIIPVGVSPIRDRYPHGVTLSILELLRYNVSDSDGSACDVLIRILGGCQKINQYIHSVGIRDIAISTTEMVQVSDDWVQYRNWVKPEAMLLLLKKFYAGQLLNRSHNELLLNLMIKSGPGAKRLKGMLPAQAVVAHKPGSSGTHYGLTRTTNDVGIITLPNNKHLLIAVFIADTYADTEEREGVIAQIAKAAWDNWGK